MCGLGGRRMGRRRKSEFSFMGWKLYSMRVCKHLGWAFEGTLFSLGSVG